MRNGLPTRKSSNIIIKPPPGEEIKYLNNGIYLIKEELYWDEEENIQKVKISTVINQAIIDHERMLF